ncbi:hypothetical protein NMG46_13175, partial [Mesorhizobium sp. LMG 17147]|uniref:hypothetical protein n=1 Tax=Mesorhizobium sp. LMG 17147 TaxID=2963091 RepID=UPI0020C93F47
REDHPKAVASSDTGLHSSQHLESQNRLIGNPLRFRQIRNRSSSQRSQPTGSNAAIAAPENAAQKLAEPKSDAIVSTLTSVSINIGFSP